MQQHLDQYGRDACTAAIIRAWLTATGLKPTPDTSAINQALDTPPAPGLEHSLLAGPCPPDLQACFQALTTSQGAVYTPTKIVDQILQRSLDIGQFTQPPRLIDPGCGAGAFLVRAAPILARKFRLSLRETLETLIHGADLDETAIRHARISLETLCLEQGQTPPERFNLVRQDSLLDPGEETFEIVVMNPPYVRFRDLEEGYRQQLIQAYPGTALGNFSLANIFLVAGYRLLAPQGVLGCITQKNIMTNRTAAGVRRFLEERRALHTLIDFGHTQVFPDARTYTCLLFLTAQPQQTTRFTRCRPGQLEKENLHELDPPRGNGRNWRLARPDHLRNIRRLESQGTPLGRLAGIHCGFATLLDQAFLVSQDIGQKAGLEPAVTAPAIRVPDLAAAKPALKVIRPYRKEGSEWLSLEPGEFREMFPKAHRHLLTHREALEQRDRGKYPGRPFHEWGRRHGLEAPGPKLLTPTYSRGPRFILDHTDSLFCNGYSVTPKTRGDMFFHPVSPELLAVLLNSWVMDYYARITSLEIQGGYQFQKNNIERFCLPDIGPGTARELLDLRGNELQEAVCRIFGLEPREVRRDAETDRLQPTTTLSGGLGDDPPTQPNPRIPPHTEESTRDHG